MNKGLGPKIIDMRRAGHTYKEICAAVGCSAGVVSYHCTRMQGHAERVAQLTAARYARVKAPPIPAEKRRIVRWLLGHGVRRCDVADALDLDIRSIRREPFVPAKATGYDRLRLRRLHLKMLAVARLGGQCTVCGYKQSLRALTFHHTDPSTKSFAISQNANRAWGAVKAELSKCVLLCANCHGEEHDAGLVPRTTEMADNLGTPPSSTG